ncbi:MAG: PVC-type heme-binding CxxCH protein [Verrucomicrobiota bacterium]
MKRVGRFLLRRALFSLAALACPAVESATPPPAEEPLPPSEAAATMELPAGFRATLFAAEPDVVQPVSLCFDDRGRLWVAEAVNYPDRFDAPPRDRITIFEDTNGDGKADKRTVFYDKLNYVTGLEVGFGGAWVMSPPHFYFIPDRNGDDKPDGEPQVLLDGFGIKESRHNLANGFTWGPDGWLYAGHGRTSPSDVGRPGTPAERRIHFDGGVYRYHPVRHVFEAFADGTTNPWGIDFDDYGQPFISNCVNPHLFHVIQGAHYEPWRNRPSSQFAYERIRTIADHVHWADGRGFTTDRADIPKTVTTGGGHAHVGMMIYLGDNWPDRYRNDAFMFNVHGRRLNHDHLVRRGSGYVASHEPDFMQSQDPWFMGVNVRYGPDGGVFMSDWNDTGECHSYVNTRRGTGRLFKVTYGTPRATQPDVSKLGDAELVALHLHKNDWWVRHARRVLQERAAAGRDLAPAHTALRAMFANNTDVTRQLRALWTLHATGGAGGTLLLEQLAHTNEHVRAWSVRVLTDPAKVSAKAVERFADLAAQDQSPLVRLHLASALQRLPLNDRWAIAEGLVGHADDVDDANLPLMVWYGIEPLVKADTPRALKLMPRVKSPLVRQFIVRRAAEP